MAEVSLMLSHDVIFRRKKVKRKQKQRRTCDNRKRQEKPKLTDK